MPVITPYAMRAGVDVDCVVRARRVPADVVAKLADTIITRAVPTQTRRLVRNPACRPRDLALQPDQPAGHRGKQKPRNPSPGPRSCALREQ